MDEELTEQIKFSAGQEQQLNSCIMQLKESLEKKETRIEKLEKLKITNERGKQMINILEEKKTMERNQDDIVILIKSKFIVDDNFTYSDLNEFLLTVRKVLILEI